jgi:hypothetical protein
MVYIITFFEYLAYLFLLSFLFLSLTNFLLSIAVASPSFLVEENSVDNIFVEGDSIASLLDSFLAAVFI